MGLRTLVIGRVKNLIYFIVEQISIHTVYSGPSGSSVAIMALICRNVGSSLLWPNCKRLSSPPSRYPDTVVASTRIGCSSKSYTRTRCCPNSCLAVTNAALYADPGCLAGPSIASGPRAPQNHRCSRLLSTVLLSYSSVCQIFLLLPIPLREW